MFGPVDLSLIIAALQTARGWIELAILAACLAVGWLADDRVWRVRNATDHAHHRLPGSLARVIFPLTSLALLMAARAAYHRSGPSVLLDVAVPLLIALAAIRMLIYGLRRMFADSAWLKSSERTVSFTIWSLLFLHYVGVLPEIAEDMDALRIPIGSNEISLLTIGKGALAVILTLITTLWISGFIEQRLMKTDLDPNLRVVLSKFVRALLIVVGILIALQAIGFDLTLLAVFGGALGVGIGLGLQKLASNYISGFAIVLDRSIRMGDMVTVGERTGVVSRLTSRYVVVRSLDGTAAIVPNETMVTSIVLNHSYTRRDMRVGVTIQVSYDSDVELALALMEQAGRAEPRVLKSPNAPQAFLAAFTDSGIALELGVWIPDPENGQQPLRSALNRAIWGSFQANGIKMPTPQREVRMVGGPPPGGRPDEPLIGPSERQRT